MVNMSVVSIQRSKVAECDNNPSLVVFVAMLARSKMIITKASKSSTLKRRKCDEDMIIALDNVRKFQKLVKVNIWR